MNNFSALDSRNRRNLLAHSLNAFSPPFHKNYSTDSTADMKTSFGDSLFINTVHLIPEPVKTNLADSVVTFNEKQLKTNMAADTKVNNSFNMKQPLNTKSDYYPSLAGITNFFSGVFNVMGAMFQKRPNSPVQYYDCFEPSFEDHHQMTPSSLAWQSAKHEDQNINGRAQTDEFATETYREFSADMSDEFRSIAAHCEDKLNRVRLLLNNPQVHKTAPARTRRPKRAFHEAGSVEELFEDAFNPEDFISLANETFIECCSPFTLHHEELQTIDGPKIKTSTVPVKESMEIVQSIAPEECGESKATPPVEINDISVDTSAKRQVVTSCEDKVSRLKALLQSRRQKKTNLNETKLSLTPRDVACMETSPICIPKQQTDAWDHTEVIFAKELELPITPESPCTLDPSSYFDEVTGRFYSSSATDSEDSFQIVFTDSPCNRRKRIPSDCESEDSFIVFEESPDSCYTSNDVFGDDTNATNVSDSEDSDSDCESDLDSGLSTIALSHSLTRTFGDLTDGSLYEDSKSEDVVDCAFRSGGELPSEHLDAEKGTEAETQEDHRATKRGLLLDEKRKRERRKLPEKKVQFSPLPPKVHVMRVWAFAARQARAGQWERHALDRERFKRRIADVDVAISWVLKPQHRSRVMFQRFMPWWNAQKRKELAEKKRKEEEEKQKREKEEAERLATELKERLDPESDVNEVNEKQVNVRLGESNEVFKSIQENTEERVEQVSNVNVNCKINSVVNSNTLVKPDNIEVETKHIAENTLRNNICIVDKRKIISGNKIFSKGTGLEKICNGDNVNCRIENTGNSLEGREPNFKKEITDHPLEIRNANCGNINIVSDDVTLKNGDVTLENRALKSAVESVGAQVQAGRGRQDQPS